MEPNAYQEVNHHLQFTVDRLNTEGGRIFFDKLHSIGLQGVFEPNQIPHSPSDTIKWFISRPISQVESLFFAVHDTLESLESISDLSLNKTKRREAEEAATALYCIAACRFVNKESRSSHNNITDPSFYLVESPNNELLICAIIVTALFGGKLQLVAHETTDVSTGMTQPRPEFAFHIPTPVAGDNLIPDFERAVFNEIFKNKKTAANKTSIDTGSLKPEERASLSVRIRQIQVRKKCNLTLIINHDMPHCLCRDFVDHYRTPIVFPTNETTKILTGIDPLHLQAYIKEFWQNIRELCTTAGPNEDQPPKGTKEMSGTINYSAINMAITQGDHSAAQAGTGHTANITHRQDADYAALIPLLHELRLEVDSLPAPESARTKLAAHVETVKTELEKREKADSGIITTALNAIKTGGELLDGGVKFAEKLKSIYQMLTPVFGLPPLP